MSTVMGTVNKEPLRLVIILASQSIPKSYDYLCKLRKIVECVGTKFAELFLSMREDYEFRGFEITSHHCYFTDLKKTLLQLNRGKPDVFLIFFVGKFSHFTTCNNAFLNYFLIPEKNMKSLPDSLRNENDWSNKTKDIFGDLLTHLIHKICHSLGAFHADTGIMARRQSSLLSDQSSKLEDLKFVDIIDKKTKAIICESMSIITTLRPQRDLRYNDGQLAYVTDQSIAAVFFVNDEQYSDPYQEFTYLDACKSITVQEPIEWDGFVVVHFCGHIFYFSQQDVMTTRRCTRKIEF